MKQELQEQLYDKYPNIFSNRGKSVVDSRMGFGCDCGDGWYDILSSLCFMIKQHEDRMNRQQDEKYHPVRFEQVKEKYGGLRIYFSGGDDYIEGLVSMAESFSYQVCEVCGERGKPNKGGWISTLCEICRRKGQFVAL